MANGARSRIPAGTRDAGTTAARTSRSRSSATADGKVGYRGVESAAYRFEGFTAPGAEVLGGDAGLGRGARMILDALDVGRVNVACRALGILDRCLACAVEECTTREVGGALLGGRRRLPPGGEPLLCGGR